MKIATSFVGRFLRSYSEIIFGLDEIRVKHKNGEIKQFCKYEDLRSPLIFELGLFSGRVQIDCGFNSRLFDLLSFTEVRRKHRDIISLCLPLLSKNIGDVYRYFCDLAVNQYLRESDIDSLDKQIQPWIQILTDKAAKYLEDESRTQLEFLRQYLPISLNAGKLRATYEQNALKAYADFFDRAESNPLTHNQRLAVLRTDDYNLVLAAAGTGKTSVMVAKALELIKHHNVRPEDILVLAYNKFAAEELTERFEKRAVLLGVSHIPSISTFHALGRNILKLANKSVYLTKFMEDPSKLNQWVTRWIGQQLTRDISILENVLELIYQPVNPHNFKSEAEYQAYVRDNEYRTLSGDKVRGYQELCIANWLLANGIKFEYEPRYKSKRRVEEGVDYKPDFYLVEDDIYLEHFGIDRQGNTRPGIDKEKYNQEILHKRALHLEHGTKLIETFHYDCLENKLYERLAELMAGNSVSIAPLTGKELLNTLNNSDLVSDIADVLFKSLQSMRSENLDESATLEKLRGADINSADWIAKFLTKMHVDYKEELSQQKAIDFDDMILLAREVIESKQLKPMWKHILVDEFQDISTARLELIKALIEFGDRPTLTVVGDDWQSIYRFSGGKLEITTRFEEYLGKHSKTTLDKTFRYNSSIAKTAGTFVMENPEQYRKEVETSFVSNNSHVYLLDTLVDGTPSVDERVAQVVKTIRKNDSNGSIAILSRYNYLLSNARARLEVDELSQDVDYWTFYKSKGLEADYCILIGFSQGKTGFPNENKGLYIVEALLPTLDAFPHSEERRLLYVGLTRARKNSYLIADPHGTSIFIRELLSPKYDLHIASESFKERYQNIFKCPKCEHGFLRLYTGKHGSFYRCTTGLGCRVKPRLCTTCGAPSIDTWFKSICNNSDCRGETPICDKCGRPMRKRQGKYGEFWGCSGYGIDEDPCRNTRKLSAN